MKFIKSVLDIGSYSLKYYDQNRKLEVFLDSGTVGGTFTIPELDIEKFSQALDQLIEKGMPVGNSLKVLLPDQWARQLFYVVNSVPEDYTGDYIKWRLKKIIRPEVQAGCKLDFKITAINPQSSNQTEKPMFSLNCYLALVKESLLTDLISVFNQKQIELELVDLTCHQIANGIISPLRETGNFALINTGHEVTTVYFFADYQPVYVRIIEIAGRHFREELNLTNGESLSGVFPREVSVDQLLEFEKNFSKTAQKYLKELNLTFTFFNSKFPAVEIETVFVSGGLANQTGIVEFLSNFLKLELKLVPSISEILSFSETEQEDNLISFDFNLLELTPEKSTLEFRVARIVTFGIPVIYLIFLIYSMVISTGQIRYFESELDNLSETIQNYRRRLSNQTITIDEQNYNYSEVAEQRISEKLDSLKSLQKISTYDLVGLWEDMSKISQNYKVDITAVSMELDSAILKFTFSCPTDQFKDILAEFRQLGPLTLDEFEGNFADTVSRITMSTESYSVIEGDNHDSN